MSKQPAAPEIDGGRCRFERLMPAHARTHPHPHTPAHTEVCHVPAQRQQRRPFRCQTSEITSRSPPAGLWAVSPAPVCAYACVRTRVCESRHTHTHTHTNTGARASRASLCRNASHVVKKVSSSCCAAMCHMSSARKVSSSCAACVSAHLVGHVPQAHELAREQGGAREGCRQRALILCRCRRTLFSCM